MSLANLSSVQPGNAYGAAYNGADSITAYWQPGSETETVLQSESEPDFQHAAAPVKSFRGYFDSAAFVLCADSAATLSPIYRRPFSDSNTAPNDLFSNATTQTAFFSVMLPLVAITLAVGIYHAVKGFRTPAEQNYLEFAEARIARLGKDALKDHSDEAKIVTIRSIERCLANPSEAIRYKAAVVLAALRGYYPELK